MREHLLAPEHIPTIGSDVREPTTKISTSRGGTAIKFQYLLLLLGCLVITLPLEWVFRARIYRRFGTVALALLPVVVVFSIWDVVGIIRDHWSYNPAYVTGLQLPFSMPIEELAFFLVIPLCGLLTYEAVGTVLGWLADRRNRDRSPTGVEEG